MMTDTVLIAGASGRFGGAARLAFEAAGWQVRVFNRKTQKLLEAARGVDVIVNALNPPDYKNWETEIPRITGEVIEAARVSGATVLIPGNVYNFGMQPAPWSDQTAQVAASRKGEIRMEMEAAYRASGVRTIVLRAGDFFGGGVTGTWLDLVMLKSLKEGKFIYPGRFDAIHSWGYLPDLGRAAAALAGKRAELDAFCDVSFPGFSVTGQEMHAALEVVTGQSLKLEKMPWWPIRIASPFWRLGRELLEMRYLWDHPHELDGAKFNALLPDFEPTDLVTAMRACLPFDVQPNQAMIGAQRFA